MMIIEKLKKVFKTDTHSIFWHNYERRVIVGHIGEPSIGDVFTTKMKSGKIGVFEVVNVRWCGNPRNMYFVVVKDVGYWVEPPLAKYY